MTNEHAEPNYADYERPDVVEFARTEFIEALLSEGSGYAWNLEKIWDVAHLAGLAPARGDVRLPKGTGVVPDEVSSILDEAEEAASL